MSTTIQVMHHECQTKMANMIAWIHYKNVQASSLDVSEIDLKIH
jgi:hypothetical protein